MNTFQHFLKENRSKIYEAAYKNCKHDSDGHCLFPKDDEWMNDNVWEKDNSHLLHSHHSRHKKDI